MYQDKDQEYKLQCQCFTYTLCFVGGNSLLTHLEMHSAPVLLLNQLSRNEKHVVYYYIFLLQASNVVDFMPVAQLTKFLSNYYKLGRVGPLTLIWDIYRARKHNEVMDGECIVRKLLEWNTEVRFYYSWENLSSQSPVPRSYGDRTLSRFPHHVFGYLDINRSPITRLKPKIKLLRFEKMSNYI